MRLIGASLAVGWLAFVFVVVFLWPFWGWISAAVSVSMLVMIGLNLRAASQQYLVNVEKLGLIISLLVGYAGICLAIAFLMD